MTREEQIIKASQLYAKAQQKPFMDGARWADNNPSKEQIDALRMEYEKGIADAIENIVEWLKCNFNMPDDFESHLKNYMEEQQ